MRYSRKIIVLVFLSIWLVSLNGAFSQELEEAEDSAGYSFSGRDRDPFVPLVSKNGLIIIPREVDVTNMALAGIIYCEGESVAIINNEVVKTGDKIGDYRVIVIERKKVILEKDNQEFTLKLEEQ